MNDGAVDSRQAQSRFSRVNNRNLPDTGKDMSSAVLRGQKINSVWVNPPKTMQQLNTEDHQFDILGKSLFLISLLSLCMKLTSFEPVMYGLHQ